MVGGVDRMLALRAKRGDITAFERLVLMYQQLAFRAAYLITGDAQEAEDAVQEALLKAYYGLPRFRSGAPFKPWLMRLVTNEALNRRRSRARRVNLMLQAAESASTLDSTISPEELIETEELRMRVLRALSMLAEEDRVVLSYRYLLYLSVAEISAVLSCPPSTVRSRLARAVRRMESELGRSSEQGCQSSGEAGVTEAING